MVLIWAAAYCREISSSAARIILFMSVLYLWLKCAQGILIDYCAGETSINRSYWVIVIYVVKINQFSQRRSCRGCQVLNRIGRIVNTFGSKRQGMIFCKDGVLSGLCPAIYRNEYVLLSLYETVS